MSKKIGILIIFLLGFPSILFAASDLFHPYKIYPIGEKTWPEAVAIGDVNGDQHISLAHPFLLISC